MMMKFLTALIAGLLWSSSAGAQGYAPSPALATALNQSGCGDVLIEVSDLDYMRMYSPWHPGGFEQLVADITSIVERAVVPKSRNAAALLSSKRGAKQSVDKLFSNDRYFSESDDRIRGLGADWLKKLEPQILTDVAKNGLAVCDIFRVQRATEATAFFRGRASLTGFQQPYARLGRNVLIAAGCTLGGSGQRSGVTVSSLLKQFFKGAQAGDAASPAWFLELYSKHLIDSCVVRGSAPETKIGPGIPISSIGQILAASNCAAFRTALIQYATSTDQARELTLWPWLTNQLVTSNFPRRTDCFSENTADFYRPVAEMLFGSSTQLSSIRALPDKLKLALAQAILHASNDIAQFSPQAVKLLTGCRAFKSPAPAKRE